MKNTIVVNLFAPLSNNSEISKYITERLENLNIDVVHYYNTIAAMDMNSSNIKQQFFNAYNSSLEWLNDYYGITEVIVNECPLAQYAYYGNHFLTSSEQNLIIKNFKSYNNFNIIILPQKLIEEDDEIDKIITFLRKNNINSIFIAQTTAHYDQVIKDIMDMVNNLIDY